MSTTVWLIIVLYVYSDSGGVKVWGQWGGHPPPSMALEIIFPTAPSQLQPTHLTSLFAYKDCKCHKYVSTPSPVGKGGNWWKTSTVNKPSYTHGCRALTWR